MAATDYLGKKSSDTEVNHRLIRRSEVFLNPIRPKLNIVHSSLSLAVIISAFIVNPDCALIPTE